MKHILLASAILVCAYTAHAQAGATGGKWTGNSTTMENETSREGNFSKTSVKMLKRKIVFAGLPQMSRSAIINITDKEGELVKQSRINPVDNTVDLKFLDHGTYFIHLRYRNEDKRGFVLNL